jgi:hypothetical protein
VGLLILRLATGSSIMVRGLAGLGTAQAVQPVMLGLAAILVSAFLAVGLLTPLSGCLVAAFALWDLIRNSGDYWNMLFWQRWVSRWR